MVDYVRVDTSTRYTDKRLRQMAQRAIRDRARESNMKARLRGFEISIRRSIVTLVATGEWTNAHLGAAFEVKVFL
jgi:ribosomal protein S20